MKTTTLITASLICFAATAFAQQHSDIELRVADNQLVTYTNTSVEPVHVFAADTGEFGLPGWTDDPGVASSELAPGSLVGFNVLGGVRFWDGAAWVAPPADEGIEFASLGTPFGFIDGATTLFEGPWIAQAGPGGGVHEHISFWIQHPDFDDSSFPPVNPFTEGAYAFVIEMTSSAHAPAAPAVVIFNAGASDPEFDAALAAADDLLSSAPECPADLTGDGLVDAGDLNIVLSNWGPNPAIPGADLTNDNQVDGSDLNILLSAWGSCE